MDGTPIPIDRIAANEPYHSMKHRRHGMNVRVIARPDGTRLRFSRAAPGRAHVLTAARAHRIVQACPARQIPVLADRAYQGAGATVRTPCYRHHELPEHYQHHNRDHARLRAPGERAFARLKSWRALRRARCSTRCASRTVQAVHTLLTCDYTGWKRFTEESSSDKPQPKTPSSGAALLSSPSRRYLLNHQGTGP